MYTGPNGITRTHIDADGDLEEGALATVLRVVTYIEDLTRAVLPQEELALCADSGRVALQATLPEFDAQGLVERPGRRNPGTIQIPGVDEEAGSRQQTSDRDTAGGRPRPAAGTLRAVGSRLATGTLLAAASRPAARTPQAAGRRPKGTRGNVPGHTLPKDPAGGQRKLEGPRPIAAPGPSTPALEPSAPAGPEPRAPTSPKPRVVAAPEQPAPSEPTPSIPRAERVAAVEVVAARAAPTRAREVIEWLEVAVATKRAELDKDHTALVEERGRLEEVGKLLEAHIASASATHERSMRVVAEQQEALEEVHDEAVTVQEKASRMERQATERDQASRRWAAELLARERLLLAREEAVGKREKSVQSA
ncbi:uncharacterized protein LOC133883382 [Phragmites australis]|uniref:uncharacterized protein LOC133883382 n=1 Tax=Phragmites australis TaxID=29695 RepID=UPI002D77DBF7|nr:uncharacterized protein LOC133883382 [Phragmites australis]